jgi:N-acetylneuraminic acid mutarotase
MPAVVDKDIIYVIGGYVDGANEWLATVESYNTTTDTWTEETPLLEAKSWLTAGLLGATVVAADGQISGNGGAGTPVGDNEGYNAKKNTWTELTADPTPRLESCFAAIKGQLYVAGGANSTETLSVNEAYDAKTKSWTTLASMPDAVLVPSSATVGGRLYCIGGSDVGLANIFDYVQIYQP